MGYTLPRCGQTEFILDAFMKKRSWVSSGWDGRNVHLNTGVMLIEGDHLA